MPFQTRYDQYDIEAQNFPPSHESAVLQHFVQTRGIISAAVACSPDEEERRMAMQDVRRASLHFEPTRRKVRGALSAIVGAAWNRFSLPREDGCDFGCGGTGEMVEELIPPFVDRTRFWQVDINPAAVAENKRRHPRSSIKQGSYLNIRGIAFPRPLKIATGLSSFDCTMHLDRAVHEVAENLNDDGFFLHVQDVRPGDAPCLSYMAERQGVQAPYPVEFGENQDVLLYETPWGKLSVGEIFRRHIGNVIRREPKLELMANEWVTASRPLVDTEAVSREVMRRGCSAEEVALEILRRPDTPPARIYHLNMFLQNPVPVEVASAVVTVARRKRSA